MTAARLDPLSLPLAGSRLIEASAGTGKTWTIAALYLRLVLGHGDDGNRPARALGPAEILVMTFTRAATRELSDRIRARLAEAARCFRGEGEPAPQDAFLRALIDAYPVSADEGPRDPSGALLQTAPGAPRSRLAAAHRLALAAEAMDDAAVHTIDAWCQRMLQEHAFDSGQRFDEELLADETLLQREAVHDYWRREVYPLDGAALDLLLSVWPDVTRLAQQLRGLPASALDGSDAEASLAERLRHRLDENGRLKAGWADRAERLRHWLMSQREAKRFSGTKLQAKSVDSWCDTLVLWARSGLDALPDLKTGRSRLTPQGLADALTKGKTLPELPPEVEQLGALFDALERRMPLREVLLRHAAGGVARQLAALKRRRGCFGFADLQARLDHALAGPAGARLRQRIVAQYPAVLIDEFQDTSPLQYRLFDRLYDVAADRHDSLLLLIGDPKQSIYGFRGADIYSYLAARQATAGRHHMLGVNYRSTAAMVDAVNRLFGQAESGWPQAQSVLGAFAAEGGAFALPHRGRLALPFEPVTAQGRQEAFVVGDGCGGTRPVAALQLQWLPQPLGAEALRRLQAEHAAAQLVALLADPQAGFVEPTNGGLRRLRPGDCAVLVRHRREAEAIRRELRRRGVASVYLSDQESVLRSPEAADMLRWLQAVAEPLDADRVRAAYATATLGLRWAELQALRDDEAAWEERQGLLLVLRRVWERQGVLAMLLRSLHALNLPARWLQAGTDEGGTAGERRLTNWLHLAELLQASAAQLDGDQALIRWLAEEIRAGTVGADDRIVRLESDADLVQVVTVHKSKGLEYPLVFLPFGQSCRPVDRRGTQVLALPMEGDDAAPVAGRRLDFGLGDEALAQADRERLREDLRLLYVALTRARHAVWLGVGLPAEGRRQGRSTDNALHRSALGYLLCAGRPVAAQQAEALLRHWAGADRDPGADGGGWARFERLQGDPSAFRWSPPWAPARLAAVQRLPVRVRDRLDWSVGSFSALVRDLAQPTGFFDAATGASASVAGGFHERSGDAPVPALRQADALRLERWREVLQADPEPGGAVWAAAPRAGEPPLGTSVGPDAVLAPWHRFPRGALPGNFLHDQLEWLADEGRSAGAAFADPTDPAVQAALERRCARAGYGEWSAQVSQWLLRLLCTPLPPLGAPLTALPQRLPEMEFWMPAAALASDQLDALCRRHLLPGQQRPALQPRRLHGLLMGFADLVFEHGGRWWVLDYKSNALGDGDAAYDAAALDTAMLSHRYELQAALYMLALHRLLRSRLGAAYDPAAQLGGAIYLFLRGIAAPGAGCVFLPADPALLEALDAAMREEAAPW